MHAHLQAPRTARRVGLALGLAAAVVAGVLLLSSNIQNRLRFAWRFAKIDGNDSIALYRERATGDEWWLIHPEALTDAEGIFAGDGDRLRRYAKKRNLPLVVRNACNPKRLAALLVGERELGLRISYARGIAHEFRFWGPIDTSDHGTENRLGLRTRAAFTPRGEAAIEVSPKYRVLRIRQKQVSFGPPNYIDSGSVLEVRLSHITE